MTKGLEEYICNTRSKRPGLPSDQGSPNRGCFYHVANRGNGSIVQVVDYHYPHMLNDFVGKNRKRHIVVLSIVPASVVERSKLMLMKQVATICRKSSAFVSCCMVFDGKGYMTSEYALGWTLPAIHIIPARTDAGSEAFDEATSKSSAMYKAVVEFSATWTMSAIWAFLQEHSRGAWLQDILAQTAELGAYANEHDVHGLCLGLLSAALSERPAAADLKRWAEIHFGDEATWYGESDYKKALQARVQDEDTHDGSDGAVAASPSLSFRFKSPHDGPFAETARFRKKIDDYVKRFVAGTVEVNLECTPDVDAEYLEQSGVTKLLECVLQSVRCFHPPEPLEAFVAYQLRMGLT